MKIILTGGHLSPLLSLIDGLKKENELLVIGRKHALEGDTSLSLEYKILKEKGIPFTPITTGRLQRKLTSYTLTSLLKFPIGFIQSFIILRKFNPQIVLTFGGYISLPVAISALILKIPVVIHEQTLEAGLSNKIIASFAKKVCISWETSRKFFPKQKTVITGNPLRKEILEETSKIKIKDLGIVEKMPIIYITGGSLGAHAINILVEGCITRLLKKYIVIHQTGDAQEFKDFERLESLRKSLDEKLKNRYILKKFLDVKEVSLILKNADLIISRSGVNTVTELLYVGKPSLLIPLPFSQKGEQLENALFLKETGLSEVMLQGELTSEILYSKITSMIDNKDKYLKSSKKAQSLVKTDAVERIIDVLEEEVQ